MENYGRNRGLCKSIARIKELEQQFSYLKKKVTRQEETKVNINNLEENFRGREEDTKANIHKLEEKVREREEETKTKQKIIKNLEEKLQLPLDRIDKNGLIFARIIALATESIDFFQGSRPYAMGSNLMVVSSKIQDFLKVRIISENLDL
ncbi:3821_t:CDS:2 [Funneliformis mosseae]|uniref:3821_t:CDS:1 n=1 Tax=Funneliformis mosseae TaxID=27381 RepID=A0A9N9FFQ8_FUNMO|nr:3821_t:CDS:2 [Funneliformis mosseae]